MTAITMNITSTAILIMTMMAFALADSFEPRISSRQHMKTRMTAGRLMMPSPPKARL